jgi:hypothetical protein
MLLERFYRYVADRHAEATQRINSGSKPEQHDAVVEFAALMGLGNKTTLAKQALLLACFANYIMGTEHADELRAAIHESRKAILPIDVRKAAVSEVQNAFGIISWGAARRQLSDAKSVIARDFPGFTLFNACPIPGGDVGED